MDYKSLSKTKAKEFKSLSSKKERDRQALFLAEGSKCVLDSLSAFIPEAIIASATWIESHPEVSDKFFEKIFISDSRGLEIISSLRSLPEVIAVFRKPKLHPEIPKLKSGNLYVLLDEIQDPGNLGTIIRTCDWFGVYDIFASKNTVDVYSPKVVQASMGSLSRVRIHYVDLKYLIEFNKEVPVIGTLLEGEDINKVDLKPCGMLLMGNEGNGISEPLKKLINIPLTIPPVNPLKHPDSLNVAIATAILLSKLKSLSP